SRTRFAIVAAAFVALGAGSSLALAGSRAGTAEFPIYPIEHFNYADGNIVQAGGANGGWYAHSSGGTGPVQVIGGRLKINQNGTDREDVSMSFTEQQTNAKTYASFTINVPAGGTLEPFSVTDGVYFAHFRTANADSAGATSKFYGRLYVFQPHVAGSTFSLGLSATSSGTTNVVQYPGDFNLGQDYKVVIAYDAAAGSTTLWVDPTGPGSTNVVSANAA